jgi:hypothetical protein
MHSRAAHGSSNRQGDPCRMIHPSRPGHVCTMPEDIYCKWLRTKCQRAAGRFAAAGQFWAALREKAAQPALAAPPPLSPRGNYAGQQRDNYMIKKVFVISRSRRYNGAARNRIGDGRDIGFGGRITARTRGAGLDTKNTPVQRDRRNLEKTRARSVQLDKHGAPPAQPVHLDGAKRGRPRAGSVLTEVAGKRKDGSVVRSNVPELLAIPRPQSAAARAPPQTGG